MNREENKMDREIKRVVEKYEEDHPRETINAAENIFKCICENKKKGSAINLMALPQSGKTSTMIATMQMCEEAGYNHQVLISSPADKSLIAQTEGRLKKADLPVQCHRASLKKTKEASRRGANIRKDYPENMWSSFEGPNCLIFRKNSVIYIDEHHYGSGNESVLANIFELQGFDLSKPIDRWPFPIHIVYVSATPYDLYIESEEDINSVVLETSSKYVSFLDHDLKDNFLIKENYDSFIDILDEFLQKGPSYGLIRLNARRKNKVFVDEIIKTLEEKGSKGYSIPKDQDDFDQQKYNEADFLYCPINQKSSSLQKTFVGAHEEPFFDKKPQKPTIIFVDSYFKQGHTFTNKSYIGLVFEDSSASREKKKEKGTQQDDIVVQSLAGRLCGYDKPKDIEMYIDTGSIRKHLHWYFGNYDYDKIPNSAKSKTSKQVCLKAAYKIDVKDIPNYRVLNAVLKINSEPHHLRNILASKDPEVTKKFDSCVSIMRYKFCKWKGKKKTDYYKSKLEDIVQGNSQGWIKNHFQSNKDGAIFYDEEEGVLYLIFREDQFFKEKKISKKSMHHRQQKAV